MRLKVRSRLEVRLEFAEARAFHSHARGGREAILLTVFLKHDQSQNLTEIQKLQEEQGFWKAFPAEGTTVVSWY